MEYEFLLDERLGIRLPFLKKEWEDYPPETQEKIMLTWERIRGNIPTRIFELEQEINDKQAQLNVEPNFQRSCELNSEIAELASVINDLWIWYRANEDVSLEDKSHL